MYRCEEFFANGERRNTTTFQTYSELRDHHVRMSAKYPCHTFRMYLCNYNPMHPRKRKRIEVI